MKNQSFQQFKTTDVLLVLGLTTVVVLIISQILLTNGSDNLQTKVVSDMEGLTNQILNGGLDKTVNDTLGNNRVPASVVSKIDLSQMGNEGEIGTDPWGNAFHYRVLSAENLGFVVIVSGGPDGNIQTDYNQIKVGPNGHLLGAQFAADDLGYVKKIQ